MTESATPPDPSRWWRNRRRMAWVAMIAGAVYPVLVLATESSELGDIAGPFYLFVGMVVGVYIGAATWNDNVMGR